MYEYVLPILGLGETVILMRFLNASDGALSVRSVTIR